MAKIEINAKDVEEQIKDLALYRSGWSNSIREGWKIKNTQAQELLFNLYQISGCIILALQDVLHGCYRDKMPMILIKRKLLDLTQSKLYKDFDEMGQQGMCFVVTTGTKHHIRIMMECLDILTA